jgi:hypothetical protein
MRDGLRIRKRIRAGWDQMAAGALDNARGRIDRFGATSGAAAAVSSPRYELPACAIA